MDTRGGLEEPGLELLDMGGGSEEPGLELLDTGRGLEEPGRELLDMGGVLEGPGRGLEDPGYEEGELLEFGVEICCLKSPFELWLNRCCPLPCWNKVSWIYWELFHW